jgi:hypothetical protein
MELARKSDGKLWFATEFGSYPIVYKHTESAYTHEEFEVCGNCANRIDDESPGAITSCYVYWEGPTMTCEECGCDIEAAYPESAAEPH